MVGRMKEPTPIEIPQNVEFALRPGKNAKRAG
jgi:hypothetical protein